MTKRIRIENADTSDHKVRVYAEDRQADGTWRRVEGAGPMALDYPTMLVDGAVWADRRLVVEEFKE